MGLTVSIGKDNDELVDNLVSNNSVKSERIEKIMRLVDRGKFVPESERENAYKDSAWKEDTGEPGALHLSAPCIYASVLENIDLEAGMSFLNVGSGTGYLSSMAGFIIGEKGVSHGVELYPNITAFATKLINEIQRSDAACAFEWCTPQYMIGNAFQIESKLKYDRIYCGALVPENRRAYFCSFLKIGGVLIMPYGHSLQKIIRKSETEFGTRIISAVTFSHLIPVNPENPLTNQPAQISFLEPLSLRSICRNSIRRLIRQKVIKTQKVEVRIICNNKEESEENRRIRDEDESSQGSDHNPDANVRINRFHPLILLAREHHDERIRADDGDGQDQQPPIQRFNHPMRHLFALVARERLNRHHAARARQEAGIADEQVNQVEEEEHGEYIRLRIRNRTEQPPEPSFNSDVEYGFRFISEHVEDDDEEQPIHDLLNANEREIISEDEDEDTDGQNITYGENDEDQERNMTTDIEVNESSELIQQHGDCENEDEEHENRNVDVSQHILPLAASSPNVIGCRSLDAELSTSEAANQTVQYCSGEIIDNEMDATEKNINSNNSVSLSGKRQRTFTSQSLEHFPCARKIKRIVSREQYEAGTSSSSGECSVIEKKLNNTFQQDDFCENKDVKAMVANDVKDRCFDKDSVGNKSGEDGPSSPVTDASYSEMPEHSAISKEDVKLKVTAEQQAEFLRNFHNEFTRLLDTLPLNVQMRQFLNYELN